MPGADADSSVHGGPDVRELRALGVDYTDVADFSVTTNPYGPHPAMLRAIHAAALDRYPDPGAWHARERLGQFIGVDPSAVIAGNGAAELLFAIARAELARDACLLMVEPTFSELRSAAVACGARVETWRAERSTDFAIDLDAVGVRAREVGATLIYLCSPNTPTGVHVAAERIASWAARSAALIVLDQSFLSLSDAHADRDYEFPSNVLVVRSLTKDHAIPGVRAGYAIADPSWIVRVAAQRPAWATSAVAEAAAIAATELDAFVATSRARLRADREQLSAALSQAGLRVRASCAPFVLVEDVQDVADLRVRLLQNHRVLVRDCASFGLPRTLRLAARPALDRARLLHALRQEVPSVGR